METILHQSFQQASRDLVCQLEILQLSQHYYLMRLMERLLAIQTNVGARVVASLTFKT